jgi:head-tail adaptor
VRAGDLRERITLERLSASTGDYEPVATVWASVDPLGEERYRIRIRARGDLRSKQDVAPAMRVLWSGRTLDLDDVIEVERQRETHLMASARLIENPHLESGARRTQAWP